jgi:hypothetical protein
VRSAAAQWGFGLSTAAYWIKRTRGKRLDRVDFANRTPGRAWNRCGVELERRIVSLRHTLREHSVLGEYGLDAIATALRDEAWPTPSRATIYRVLERHGMFDAVHRERRPAPPKGWYLPDLANGHAELDSFDFIEDLKIADGPLVSVLTGTSVHGALADAWVMPQRNAQRTVEALLGRWREFGLPDYAQFDNDTVFQGAHQFPDALGRVIRLCLALKAIPVFAPPREPGFQNAIEGFNGLWQSKVCRCKARRDRSGTWRTSADGSARYITAYRGKTAIRRDNAPSRRRLSARFRFDLDAPCTGTIIFIRRSDDDGRVHLLGRNFAVDTHWTHRLVRCEVNLTEHRIRFHALRRRHPQLQPLLRELDYTRPDKPFQGTR